MKRRFKVFSVKDSRGEWHLRAYRLDGMNNYARQKPPVRLEKRFIGIVETSTSGRAIRAAIEHESAKADQP